MQHLIQQRAGRGAHVERGDLPPQRQHDELVDVAVARQEMSIPPAISAEQAKGFTLYAIRTILAGRADELLDLISTNVARRILD